VVDLRHPVHHLLVPELPEGLKVEMPKPLMPTPGLIISTSGEVEGPSHLHVKHVQPITPTIDLGEKTTMVVPDTEHPSVNLHSQAALVELVEADDGVPEGRDVVDSREQLVFAGLTHEHDGPDATNLHRGLVAKLDEAPNVAVQVGEVPNAPSHVVRDAVVEVPSLELVVIRVVAEECLHVRLMDVEQG
jgi:hypothetical protein